MGHANAPLMGMQGPHRHREAAQWVILHSAAVLLAGQILLTCLHHASFFTVVINMKDKRFLHHRLCFSQQKIIMCEHLCL